jgi:large subunit ribosomal protein L25
MELIANKRTKLKKVARALKAENRIPGVIYGAGMESLPISLSAPEFKRVFKESGRTNVIDVKVDKEKYKVLIGEIQRHHIDLNPLHISFHKIDLKSKITANIPVHIIGEENCVPLESPEAVLLLIRDRIEVSALPMDLIDEFVVDISELKEIGDIITMEQLNFDKKKIEITDFDPEYPIVKIDFVAQEVEEEEDAEFTIDDIEATEEKGEEEDSSNNEPKKEE